MLEGTHINLTERKSTMWGMYGEESDDEPMTRQDRDIGEGILVSEDKISWEKRREIAEEIRGRAVAVQTSYRRLVSRNKRFQEELEYQERAGE